MNWHELALSMLAPFALVGKIGTGREKVLDRLLFKVDGLALRTHVDKKRASLDESHANLVADLEEAKKKDEADLKKMAENGAPDTKPWLTYAGQVTSNIEANRAEESRLRLISRNVAVDDHYSLTVGDLEYLGL